MYPLEPIVEYESFVINGPEGKARISFNFTDGDGDIGLLVSDTLPPYDRNGGNYFNFFLSYFEKDDLLGWVPGVDAQGNPIVLEFRLKPILDYGISKGIAGVISHDFDIFFNANSSQSDTIKYEFQLIDRALNKSNIDETVAILTP